MRLGASDDPILGAGAVPLIASCELNKTFDCPAYEEHVGEPRPWDEEDND